MLTVIDEKRKGREITIPARAAASGRIIDLMEALKESMRKADSGERQVEQENRRKA